MPHSCVLCGNDLRTSKTDLFFAKGNTNYSVYFCKQCGLGFTDPAPNSDELTLLYNGYYTEWGSPKTISNKAKTAIRESLAKRFNHENVLVRLASRCLGEILFQGVLPPPFGKKKVLDVGCGYGRLLDIFKIQGWETYGVEPGKEAAEIAKKNGHHIHFGNLFTAQYEPLSFSIIIFCHSFEHIADFRNTLAESKRILSQDGLLIIEVPNADCFDARFLGSSWLGWHVPFHLYHWKPRALSMALQAAGFMPQRWKYKLPTIFDRMINNRNFAEKNGDHRKRLNAFLFLLLSSILCILKINRKKCGHFFTVYARKTTATSQ
jgi:SAM-dependent methyltransferase